MPEDVGAWSERVAQLTDKLSKLASVRRAGMAANGEPPEKTLAHALADIEEECGAVVNEYLPRLLNATSADELEDALTDLREGMRHLAYHLKDSPYLRIVLD